MYRIFRLMLCVFALSLLAGCYNKPVRHLNSDVSLIKKGTSTRQDVLLFIGEPDDMKIAGDGLERWIYSEELRNTRESLPLIGEYLGNPDVTGVVVIMKNGIVIDTTYTASDADEVHWRDDFDWQEPVVTSEEDDDGWF
ncbi:MAG: hypothetical protein OCC45_13445 [Desulfotalea sp.]